MVLESDWGFWAPTASTRRWQKQQRHQNSSRGRASELYAYICSSPLGSSCPGTWVSQQHLISGYHFLSGLSPTSFQSIWTHTLWVQPPLWNPPEVSAPHRMLTGRTIFVAPLSSPEICGMWGTKFVLFVCISVAYAMPFIFLKRGEGELQRENFSFSFF